MKNKIQSALQFYNINCIVNDAIENIFSLDYKINLIDPVRFSKIKNLESDISIYCNCEITIINENYSIYARVKKSSRNVVYFSNYINLLENTNYKLPVFFGVDTQNNPIIKDLTKLPHLLVAGTTGSGKSSFLHTLIVASIKNQAALALVDCKQIELTRYDKFNCMVDKTATDPKNACILLYRLVREMEYRYNYMKENNIHSFDAIQDKFSYIVCVIDELADLLSDKKYKKLIESHILRLAQKARAIGIHLVLCTQRPDSKIISGTIKANIPSRLCFTVNSAIDSRIILDCNGAEKLTGNGDGLLFVIGENKIIHIQSGFISDKQLTDFINQSE